ALAFAGGGHAARFVDDIWWLLRPFVLRDDLGWVPRPRVLVLGRRKRETKYQGRPALTERDWSSRRALAPFSCLPRQPHRSDRLALVPRTASAKQRIVHTSPAID